MTTFLNDSLARQRAEEMMAAAAVAGRGRLAREANRDRRRVAAADHGRRESVRHAAAALVRPFRAWVAAGQL